MTATPETPAKPCPHPHGSRNRWEPRACHAPCREFCCRIGKSRSDRAYDRARRNGVVHWADPAPVAELIRAWRDRNVSWPEIAAATGVGKTHLEHILAGRYRRITAILAEIIAAAQISPPLSAVACVRLLRAYAADGFTFEFISAETGCDRRHLRRLANGEVTRIFGSLARRIAEFHDRWHAEEGTSKITRSRAAKHGWLPREAWTEETLSDPDAEPWGHIPDRRWDADPVKVWRVTVQTRAFELADLTSAERLQAVARLMERNLDSVQISDFTGWNVRSVVRIRAELRGRGTWDEYALRLRCKHQAVAAQSPDEVTRADARTSLRDLADLAAHIAELLAGQGVAA